MPPILTEVPHPSSTFAAKYWTQTWPSTSEVPEPNHENEEVGNGGRTDWTWVTAGKTIADVSDAALVNVVDSPTIDVRERQRPDGP